MKPRTVFIGCLTGLIASRLLFPVFTDFVPGYLGLALGQQLPTPTVVQWLCILSALVILGSGYVAARLEWTQTWQRAVACGVNLGLLAGCLAYMLSGAPAAAGVLGQKEILLSLGTPIASESAGIGLLVLGVVNTAVWTQAVFWVIMLPSLVLGALGGLLSRLETGPGWLSEPAAKNPDLERLFVYSFFSFGLLNLVICIVVMTLMPGVAQKAILENNLSTSGLLAGTSAILSLPILTAAAGLIPCLILAIKWTLEAWEQPKERFKVKAWLWANGFFALILLFINLPFALAVIGACALTGAAFWVIRRKRPPTPPALETFKPNTPLDYLASGLTQGILLGTLATVLSIAYSLSLILIAVVNIPHLTLSGVVNSTAQGQVTSLYTTLGGYNLILLLSTSAFGLILTATGGLIDYLRSRSKKQVQTAPATNLGGEQTLD